MRKRFTPSMVVAVVALLVSLGGGAIAASTRLPENSVGTRQVINGSLQRNDLSKKTIAQLRGRTGARGLVGLQGPSGATGAQGAQGAQGAPGAPGAPGAQGPPGIANVGRFELDSSFVDSSDPHFVWAFVATGSRNSECLTTINDSTLPWPGETSGAFCDQVVHDGVQGLVINVLLTNPAPPSLMIVITAWQKGAQQYPNAIPCNGPC